jgi:hypothetical protein
MIAFFKKFFKEYREEPQEEVSIINDNFDFTLKIEDVNIGYLRFEKGLWRFEYSEAFRNQNKYSRIIGFSDSSKVYTSELLWPFFRLRIPGLKQPMIQEILEKENIDKNNIPFLLKRFGKINISNPYILEAV